jgi:hypothetical protein
MLLYGNPMLTGVGQEPREVVGNAFALEANKGLSIEGEY